MAKKKEYALYKGDKFIDIGTLTYLAKLLNVDEKTIKYYSTPGYLMRCQKYNGNGNYLVVVKLDTVEDI